MTDSDRYDALSDKQLHEIHSRCEAFEQALCKQETISIDAWLVGASDQIRDVLFRELLTIELEGMPTSDKRIQFDAYLARYPEHNHDIKQVFHEFDKSASAEGNDWITRPPTLLIPDRNCDSRYRLGDEIARGGAGVILHGRDTDLGRDLAIKVLLDSHKDNPEVARRFVEEAQISGQLQHPGIAPVYELGQFSDKRLFFSMKLIKGQTLSKLLSDREDAGKDRGRFISIFEQICQTMAYTHSRGVIHRDLKPANIMVGAFGEVQVMDWGLAKVLTSGLVADLKNPNAKNEHVSVIATSRSVVINDTENSLGVDSTQTKMGSVMGTPAYMPPEQALGEIDNLDQRADVFCLGAILCEILTGKPPYVSDEGNQVFRLASRGRLTSCYERLDECGADPDLIALAKHCLQPEQEDRPGNAAVLAERVSGYLASVEAKLRETEMDRAVQVARLEQQQQSTRKLRRVVAGLAVVTLLAGFACVAALLANERANDLATTALALKSVADLNTEIAKVAKERAQEQLTRSEWLVYVGKLMLAQTDFESARGVSAMHCLDDCQDNLRGWEYRYLLTRISAEQTLVGHSGEVKCVAVSFDGKLIATGGSDNSAHVWNAETGQSVFAVHGHTGHVNCVAFSPDGKRFATGSEDKTVKVWDAQSGRQQRVLNELDASVQAVAFSPDGKRIATGVGSSNQPSEVTIWDAQTGQELLVINEYEDWVTNLAFSPDGKRIVTAIARRATIWDTQTGQEIWSVRHGGILGLVWCVAFSPDGQRIVSGSEDGNAKVWNAETGDELFTLKGHAGWVASVTFSSDGRQIVTGSWDNTVKLWDAERGEEVFTLKGHAGRVYGVAISRDGKRIYSCSADQTAKVWDAESGQQVIAIKRGPVGAVFSIAFSPDSKRIVTGSNVWNDYTLQICNADTGLEPRALTGHTDIVRSVAFSPDGRRVVSGSKDKTVRVWDATTAQQIHVLNGHTFPVAFSPDGQYIVTGHEDNVTRLLDSKTFVEVRTLDGHAGKVRSVAFSPDGSRIVMGYDDHTSKVWNTQSGKELFVLQGHFGRVNGVVFSPDGQRIATSSVDKTARVWDASTGQELFPLEGHTAPVRGVAFSPDGARIVTASDDLSAKLWDAHSGLEVLSLNGHKNEVLCVAFSPDGQSIVTGTANPDNTARVWHALDAPKDNVWMLPTEPHLPKRN